MASIPPRNTGISPDVVSVSVRDYTVQVYSEYTNWTDCVMYVNAVGKRVSTWAESTTRNVPATFTDVTDAEEYLNELRDRNPERTYRMTRVLEITEVVHA